eukprot:tig00000144_g9090.t1
MPPSVNMAHAVAPQPGPVPSSSSDAIPPTPLKQFYESGRFADCYIRVEGTGAVFAVHRVILALHSRVLEKLVQTSTFDRTAPIALRLDSPALDAVFGEVLSYVYGRGVAIRESNVVPLYLLALDLEVGSLRKAALDAARGIVEAEPAQAAVLLRQLVRTRPPHAARPLAREDPLAGALASEIAARVPEHADGKRLLRELREVADEEELLALLDRLRGVEAALRASPELLSASTRDRAVEAREAKRRRADEQRGRGDGEEAAALFRLDEEADEEEPASAAGSLARFTEEDERLMQGFVQALNIGPSQPIAVPRRVRPANIDFVI